MRLLMWRRVTAQDRQPRRKLSIGLPYRLFFLVAGPVMVSGRRLVLPFQWHSSSFLEVQRMKPTNLVPNICILQVMIQPHCRLFSSYLNQWRKEDRAKSVKYFPLTRHMNFAWL